MWACRRTNRAWPCMSWAQGFARQRPQGESAAQWQTGRRGKLCPRGPLHWHDRATVHRSRHASYTLALVSLALVCAWTAVPGHQILQDVTSNILVARGVDLRAIAPVYLVAIVFLSRTRKVKSEDTYRRNRPRLVRVNITARLTFGLCDAVTMIPAHLNLFDANATYGVGHSSARQHERDTGDA